jgi:CRP/FNR family cyclic AMP-dependent transcriptional regulator
VKAPHATDFLAERGWLARTPTKFRKEVLARIRLREFAKGETVYHAGDPPGGLWVIINGALELEMPRAETAPTLVHLVSPGWWFGEWPLIHDEPRRVTTTAIRQSTLATLPLPDCHAILKADPSAWRWIAVLSSMTSDLSAGVVGDLMLRDPEKRTAALLLRLSGMRSGVSPCKEPFPIFLSQEKIGLLANLSRNSVMPILHDFAQRGYIRVD